MGDWSILGRFLTEVQNHSTVIGKIWLTVLLIFRILLVALVGDAVYSDEQSKFTCNTLQPGCNNVCYDTFAPVSHLRFWVFQIVLVSTPSIFYIVYVLHKIAKDEKLEVDKVPAIAGGPTADDFSLAQVKLDAEDTTDASASAPVFSSGPDDTWGPPLGSESVGQNLLEDGVPVVRKDPTELSSQVLLIYIVHVVLSSIMEITFLVGQYYLFGFEVPHLFRCETYPCPNRTDCFVSRATEKTIFLNFMFSISLGCFILNIVELHYLGWVYIFRVLCSACSTCCTPHRSPLERLGLYPDHNPLLLQLKHSLQSRVVLQAPATMVQERSCAVPAYTPAISFQTDSTLQCTSRRGLDDKEHCKVKLAKLGRGEKSWL
ncbi:gap junction delta-2 protein-like [Sardina pilchardus]|uniref:gap junction delta-2 protein-like n=1 Tax=Sardina pilchardus TaxID=27697 RepID=UPI002E0FF761